MKKQIVKFIEKLNPLKHHSAKAQEAQKEEPFTPDPQTASELKAEKEQSAERSRKEREALEAALKLPDAPKGSPETDFKTALYAVCVLWHPEMRGISSLGVVAGLLGRAGFKGGLEGISEERCRSVLGELESAGALVRLPGFEVYAAPSQIVSGEAKVTAREQADFFSEERAKRYVYGITDESGQECLLKSSIVILPGDVVAYESVRGSGKAFAVKLTKKRVCVLGRVMLLGQGGRRTATVMPDEPNLGRQVFEFERPEDLGEAKAGDVVIAEILSRTSSKCLVKTREIVKDLGNLNNIIVMAVLHNDIPSSWPEGMNRALSRIPDEVRPEDTKGRRDITKVPLVTIDGEDSRDFDDAVYCQKEGSGWRLYVAIADVSYYVRPGTVLDKEAVNRCNSCYFPNYVIPMLPEKLSNGICSLNPDVDRLCMCCEMVIGKDGLTKKYDFYPAVMRSHARLTYTEAWQMITEGTAKYPEHAPRIPEVKELYNLYHAFEAARKRRGGISIETTEQHFVFNEDMEITGVEAYERNDAHRIIEECMIAANVAAATFVAEHKSQTLYRVHAKPTQKKLDQLIPQLARFGLSLTGADDPQPADYAKLADAIAKRPKDGKLLGELLLRSMSKAEYSPDNIGHFGLALQNYAHFTSPIRRYADLQLHRVVKHLLEKDHKGDWGKIGSRSYTKAELTVLGARATDREVAADMAEREVDFALACVYLEKFIGETVQGTISGCTRFGIFVHLDDFLVDGLIFIGNFPGYLNFDQRTESLISDKGKVFRIGDPIKVVVAAVNAQEHKIDLIPAGLGSTAKYKKQRDRILKEREKEKAAGSGADKEQLFGRLSDISRAREATDEDSVKRESVPAGWGSELTPSVHYANPFSMPGRRSGGDEGERSRGARGRSRKGRNRKRK
ncbi:MAG: ribonuclease R [Succinivibrio sp.]|nr:ribonuclease R [Succinivibrio sp.]